MTISCGRWRGKPRHFVIRHPHVKIMYGERNRFIDKMRSSSQLFNHLNLLNIMGIRLRMCKNKTTDLLRDTFHATPLTPPETTIQPLFVLSFHDGKVGRLGYLKELFDKPDQKGLSPKPKANTVANTELERTQKVEMDMGVHIMGALLSGFKLDASPVKASLQGAQEISFSFTNIQRFSIDVFKLGSALANKRANLDNRALQVFLEGRKPAKMLLVTDVLASNSLAINVESSKNRDFRIQLSPIQTFIANGKLGIKTSKHEEKTIAFEGPERLTFAFSCVPLIIDKNNGFLTPGLPMDGLESTRGSRGATKPKPEYFELDDDPLSPGFLELD